MFVISIKETKALATLEFLRQEDSIKRYSFSMANLLASSDETCLLSSRSVLFPNKITLMFFEQLFLIFG
jgi:hypothetical protein